MSNFQIIITGIFVIFILAAVVLFAGFGSGGVGDKSDIGEVVIWGTIDERVMVSLFDQITMENKTFHGVKYERKDVGSFNEQLLEALAEGKGPDVFLLPHSLILRHEGKVLPIPHERLPIRDFKDSFVEEGELYLTSQGILAMPFMVDPMVMYWNRDIFTGAGISNPPKLWDEFFDLAQKITKKDLNLNILQSTVAFGEFRNVTNAKEILSTLIMQTGNPISRRGEEKLSVLLASGLGTRVVPAEAALGFFTEFSNPTKSVYSWNRSLSNSKNAFLAGDLAIYFGFASELKELRSKNPNLNFDVAMVPQTEDAGANITYGKMQGLAISRNSKNILGALNTINILSSSKWLTVLSEIVYLPPVRRDLLSKKPADPYQSIFYNAALSSRGWLDPNESETHVIFQNMVESITSGRKRVSEAVAGADAEMRELVK